MGTTGNQNGAASSGSARPSLLSARTGTQDHNILDTVGPRSGGPTATRPGRLIWLLLPLVIAMIWAVFFRTRPSSAPTREVAVAQAPVQAPTPTPAPAPVSKPEPAPAPVSTDVANTPTNPFSSLASTTPSRPEAAAATVQSAPTAATNKPAAPARPVIAEIGSARKAPPAPPVNKPANKPAATPLATAVRPKPIEPPLKATAAARSPTGKNDPDVELLSAIMKHLDHGAGKPAAAARSDQTIADLVKSCQTHDAIEALLCQRRICEGSWGKAQACPPHLAPKSAATAAR